MTSRTAGRDGSTIGVTEPEGEEAIVDRSVGEGMHALIAELYPIARSITGDGVRETLRRLQKRIPLLVHEVPTGTRVFDWTVPREWNIRGAWIRDPQGETVVDFRDSNLHVVGYSAPVHRRMPLRELARHVHTLPDQPDRVPYRTAYYDDSWGFCMAHERFAGLADGEYEVRIDATLEEGSLTYGELHLSGEGEDEVLISCHVCHPSLCNDNLSGIAVATYLARALARLDRRYSYRFLFIPGTIGSITWLARNEEKAGRIRHGLVLAGVGDAGVLNYKRSRRGGAEIDRAVEHVLRHSGSEYGIRDFIPYGYDERQYCSPGFDLPVGCLMRTPWGEYPEYHTSADDLDFVQARSLADTLERCLEVIDVLENNDAYLNRNPKCEPQLGRRGLYDRVGGQADRGDRIMALLWVLNLSDGAHDLLAIADRAGLPFDRIRWAAENLVECGLLERIANETAT